MFKAALRRGFSPPDFAEPLSSGRLAVLRAVFLALLGMALPIDAAVYFGLRHSEAIDSQILQLFLWVNVPPLLFALIISAWFLRQPHRYAKLLQGLVTVILCLTTLVWVYMTGLVSSYFLVCLIMIPLGLRVVLDYETTLLATVTIVVSYSAAFALQETGVLGYAPLFKDGASEFFEITTVRVVAGGFFVWLTVICFGGANAFVGSLRSTQWALHQARGDIAKLAEGARPGRLTGQVLAGRFELREVLGRGGMGEVYRATCLQDSADCAVKVLYPHLSGQESVLSRFCREAEAAARIDGNVAPAVIAANMESEQEKFIVMEYLPGEDLAAFLRRRGRLPFAEVVGLVTEIARALDLAHDAGIVHRDVKPHNVFMESLGDGGVRIRLLDFGIAKLMGRDDTLTQSYAVMGSPGFMSPEQAVGGAGSVGPVADVFALGVIAYEALTGQRPFLARELPRALHEIAHVHPTAPTRLAPELPYAVDGIIRTALAKLPEERYQRASELAEALATLQVVTVEQTETLPDGCRPVVDSS